jgi:hypothetical protein
MPAEQMTAMLAAECNGDGVPNLEDLAPEPR